MEDSKFVLCRASVQGWC